MTHDLFTTQWNGKFLDFDVKFGYQCVDLMRAYIRDVLKLNPYILPPVQYAKQAFFNYKAKEPFTKIFNSPTNVPQKGDIVFWNGPIWGVTGVAGHVGIFQEGNVNSFISFDQNYPTGKPCLFVRHSYKGVLGWLRKN